MTLSLHNLTSEAHIEELKDRLTVQLDCAPHHSWDGNKERALIGELVDVVHAMDDGTITSNDALEAFAHHRIPGFSFGKWIVDMVDEGVYLDEVSDEASKLDPV